MSGKSKKKQKKRPSPAKLRNQAEIVFRQALAAQDRGETNTAETFYQQCLAGEPEHFPALYNLAILYHDAGRLAEAEPLYARALNLQPRMGELHKNFADLLFTRERPKEAVEHYRLALAATPDEVGAWFNLGLAERVLNHFEKALAALEQTLRLQVDHPGALFEIADLHCRRKDYPAAIKAFTSLIEKHPDDLRAREGLAEAYWNFGDTGRTRYELAIILKQDPDNLSALNLLALASVQAGDYRKLQTLAKRLLQHPKLNARVHSNLLYNQLMNSADPGDYRKLARQWWQRHGAPEAAAAAISLARNLESNRPLKVGLLSADFRRHSVSYFVLPLLKHHDPQQLQLWLYATNMKSDAVSARIASLAEVWRPVAGLDNDQLCRQIIADKLDILIELNGHTAENRLPLMARRPAPVIISWLGYPASTGLEIESFRLGDQIVDPPANAAHYSEQLLYLPAPFLCYEAPPEAVNLPPKPITENELTKEITFASFNNPAKLSDACLEIWAEILRRIPEAGLLLKSRYFNDEETCSSLIKRCENLGIDQKRVQTDPGQPDLAEHFLVYHHVDIALDPLPYNGTTTTFEALWMGIPVIVLEGKTHAARVGADIMRVLGCAELIAATPADYVAIALALAGNPERRAVYHRGLRQKLLASALMDGLSFAGNLATALRKTWRQWRSRRLTMLQAVATGGAEILQLPPAISNLLETNDKARELLEKALAGSRQGTEILLNAAKMMLEQGEFKTAAMALRELLSRQADHFAGRLLLARILAEKGRGAEAICHYQHLLRNRPAAQEVILALNQLRSLEEPNNPEWHFNLAGAYHHLHQPDKARAALEKVLQLNPADARAWSNLGLLEESQGSLRKAATAYSRAKELDPKLTEAAANLIWLMAQDCAWRGIDDIINDIEKPLESYLNPLLHLAMAAQPGSNLKSARRKSKEINYAPWIRQPQNSA